MSDQTQPSSESRRDFLKKTSATAIAGSTLAMAIQSRAHAFGSETIRIGLVGCGGRGTGAADQAMNTEGPTKLVAMGDAFADRLQDSHKRLQRNKKDKVDVPKDRQFVGLDAYKKVIDSDIDLVILTTPPGFRPQMFKYAIEKNKHVFMEKPVATDVAGIKTVLEYGKIAKEKNLAVGVGLQRRHENQYKDTIKRLHDGAIGDIVCTRVYWNGGGVWVRTRDHVEKVLGRKPTEMEYQVYNWYYFNWLCGDHINEQHIHNLDVGNWVMNDFPVEANGMGGREVRDGKEYGHIYDHHAVEYTYANGSKMFSQCRHIRGCWNHVSEYAHGAKGTAVPGGRINAKDEDAWRFSGKRQGGHQQEHHDLFALLRKGERPNEAHYGAMSTMTAILGRMATYSGKIVKMKDALASNQVLVPQDPKWDDVPPVTLNAKGLYPVPVPGKTKII